MASIHFFQESQEDGSIFPVVADELNALRASGNPKILDCVADLLARLGTLGACTTCEEAGLEADVSLTGDPDLYHYIDGVYVKTAMLLAVTTDNAGAMSQIIVMKVCKTASAFIPVEALATARKRLALLKRAK